MVKPSYRLNNIRCVHRLNIDVIEHEIFIEWILNEKNNLSNDNYFMAVNSFWTIFHEITDIQLFYLVYVHALPKIQNNKE